jgi:hypothetical protein
MLRSMCFLMSVMLMVAMCSAESGVLQYYKHSGGCAFDSDECRWICLFSFVATRSSNGTFSAFSTVEGAFADCDCSGYTGFGIVSALGLNTTVDEFVFSNGYNVSWRGDNTSSSVIMTYVNGSQPFFGPCELSYRVTGGSCLGMSYDSVGIVKLVPSTLLPPTCFGETTDCAYICATEFKVVEVGQVINTLNNADAIGDCPCQFSCVGEASLESKSAECVTEGNSTRLAMTIPTGSSLLTITVRSSAFTCAASYEVIEGTVLGAVPSKGSSSRIDGSSPIVWGSVVGGVVLVAVVVSLLVYRRYQAGLRSGRGETMPLVKSHGQSSI